MRNASGPPSDINGLTHSTGGSAAVDHAPWGFSGQTLTMALVGIAGAIFVFAAINTLSRAATVKVRKR
jgi:hypothetical protein